MKKNLLFMVVFVSVAVLETVSWAQTASNECGFGGDPQHVVHNGPVLHMARLFDGLELSENRKAELEAWHEENDIGNAQIGHGKYELNDGHGRIVLPGSAQRIEYLSGELELSWDQKAQLKSWHEQSGNRKNEYWELAREAHRKMHELINAGPVDEAAIRVEARELAELHADHAIGHAYFIQRLQSILQPHQLEKFEALKPKPGQHVKRFLYKSNSGLDIEHRNIVCSTIE